MLINAATPDLGPSFAAAPAREDGGARAKVLVMRRGDPERMAGSIPVWQERKTARDDVTAALSGALAAQDESFATSLAYASQQAGDADAARDEEFRFGDLVDMVNPLQHIPLVGHLYRSVTGDTIKPIGKIVGGAVFGGAAGAALGLTNALVEHETGTDVAGNFVNMMDDSPIEIPQKPPETINWNGARVSAAPQSAPSSPHPLPDGKSDDKINAAAVAQLRGMESRKFYAFDTAARDRFTISAPASPPPARAGSSAAPHIFPGAFRVNDIAAAE